MKNNSILEKLGIDENQTLDEIIKQLNVSLKDKTSPEKLEQIITAVTSYFENKVEASADPVEVKVQDVTQEETQDIDVVEIEPQEDNVEPKVEVVTETETEVVSESQKKVSFENTVDSESINEQQASVKPAEPFNIFKFYLDYDRNGFWSKITAGLTAVLALLSLFIASKFAPTMSPQSISFAASSGAVKSVKPMLIIMLLVIAMIFFIFFLEFKLKKDRVKALSRTLPVFASLIATLGFLVVVVPVFKIARRTANAPSTGFDIFDEFLSGGSSNFAKPLTLMQSVNYQALFSFITLVSVIALIALGFSIVKKREFRIGIYKRSA